MTTHLKQSNYTYSGNLLDNEERILFSRDVFRAAKSSRTCFLTGSAALLFFSCADEIYETRGALPSLQSNLPAILFAHRLKENFKNTLRDIQIKDIDFSVYGGLAAIERELDPSTTYHTQPGYLVVERENNHCAREYFESVESEPAGWYVRGAFGAQWTLRIEQVVIHNLVFHLFKPPYKEQLWREKIEVQFRELVTWLTPEELISHIARIARGYERMRGWSPLFKERSDANITGEVFYYLITLRGAKFLNEYLR